MYLQIYSYLQIRRTARFPSAVRGPARSGPRGPVRPWRGPPEFPLAGETRPGGPFAFCRPFGLHRQRGPPPSGRPPGSYRSPKLPSSPWGDSEALNALLWQFGPPSLKTSARALGGSCCSAVRYRNPSGAAAAWGRLKPSVYRVPSATMSRGLLQLPQGSAMGPPQG